MSSEGSLVVECGAESINDEQLNEGGGDETTNESAVIEYIDDVESPTPMPIHQMVANNEANEMEEAIQAVIHSPDAATISAAQIEAHYDKMDGKKKTRGRVEQIADDNGNQVALDEESEIKKQASTSLEVTESHPPVVQSSSPATQVSDDHPIQAGSQQTSSQQTASQRHQPLPPPPSMLRSNGNGACYCYSSWSTS